MTHLSHGVRMRHRWFAVEDDLRRCIAEPRAILHRCRVCGVYRWTRTDGERWRSVYGEPYKWSVMLAPNCKLVR